MGVTGLWRLLEPAGKPVPLETLENKVLAVDISIWLHQMVKGYQDAGGGTVVNAHLLGLFQRLCKLLYYRIKPVFVFDGGVPVLKIQTISKRQNKKSIMHNTVDRMRKQLLEIVTKQMAVSKVIAEKNKSPKKRPLGKATLMSPDNDDTLFKLPPIETDEISTENLDAEDNRPGKYTHMDLHSLDVNSQYFKSLTPRERHDLLTELKETRKQSSWGRIHELPSQSDNFSDYQMKRLLKRRQVQVSLEETEKEMGGHYLSLNELEVLLNEEGIDTKIDSIPTRQIASNENTRFVLIKDVKQALENATKKELEKNTNVDNETECFEIKESKTSLGKEYDEDLENAIKLSLENFDDQSEPSTSKISITPQESLNFTITESDFVSSDSEWVTDEETDVESPEPEENNVHTNLALVKAYMLENSGLSEHEIKKIINKSRKKSSNNNVQEKFVIPINSKDEDIVVSVDASPYPYSKYEKTESVDKLVQKSELSLDAISENSENPPIKVDNEEISHFDENTISSGIESHESIIVDNDANPVPSNISEILNISPVGVVGQMSSDSESDDSFEEVDDDINKKHNVEINLDIKTPPEDDIFADVFQDEKLACEKNYLNPNSDSNVPCTNIKGVKDGSVSTIKEDMSVKNNKIKIDVQPVQSVNSNKTKMETVDRMIVRNIEHIKKLPASQLEDEMKANNIPEMKSVDSCSSILCEQTKTHNNVSIENINVSPRKGMALNEIKHLASQESKDNVIKEKYDFFEKQLISTDELITIADDLEEQKEKLHREQNKLDRMGRNISEEMTKDAQYLLKLFGIPYIIAPMEAEAQCAFLEAIKLTDGTITDDSDIWLFGGKSVYKNFFNQQKYVLQFLSENIQNCFKLSREQLILLALLVGSDYTTGVSGVGPVTAMEILSTFPSQPSQVQPPYGALLQGLKKFKTWWNDNRAYGHGKLRSKLKNISIHQDFPNFKVVEAYMSPQVDTNGETFSWGKPDVTALRDYAKQKFGWSQTKTDEVLKPVLKRLDEKICQQSIRSFFRTEIKSNAAVDGMSKRVRKAVERMGNDVVSEDDQEPKSKIKKPRKKKQKTEDNSHQDVALSSTKEKDQSVSKDSCEQTTSVVSLQCTNNIVKAKKRKIANSFIPERYQETIPQREKDKTLMLKKKLKAIELFRTSKKGPGFVKKQGKKIRQPKLEAELSESDSD